MSTFKSIILIALLVGQTAAFMTAGKTSTKSLTSLESYYNRNYDSVGGYGNERYMDAGTRRYNEYDRGYNSRGMGMNEYNRGGMGMNDYNRGGYYGGYGGRGMMSRSKYGDWLNGSSNYIPTSADRNYVMDRGYETGTGRYNNYYGNGDRYNNRYAGGYDYRNTDYNRGGMGMNDYNRGMGMNSYNRGGMGMNGYNRDMGMNGYNRGYNEYDRYSPVGYNSNMRYGSYNREYNQNYDRSFRSSEYERTYRSPMDSHRQQYPSYSMGRMEDQFGYKKWWDSN